MVICYKNLNCIWLKLKISYHSLPLTQLAFQKLTWTGAVFINPWGRQCVWREIFSMAFHILADGCPGGAFDGQKRWMDGWEAGGKKEDWEEEGRSWKKNRKRREVKKFFLFFSHRHVRLSKGEERNTTNSFFLLPTHSPFLFCPTFRWQKLMRRVEFTSNSSVLLAPFIP